MPLGVNDKNRECDIRSFEGDTGRVQIPQPQKVSVNFLGTDRPLMWGGGQKTPLLVKKI